VEEIRVKGTAEPNKEESLGNFASQLNSGSNPKLPSLVALAAILTGCEQLNHQ